MRVLLLALALTAGGAASAQAIDVRGGEHDDFSRLVLSLPNGVAWSFEAAPGGYDLRLPPGTSYDLSNAFKRIPRDRISDLTAGGEGRLGLTVSCDCHAQAYVFEGVGLVIDVIDGPPPLGGLAPGRPAGRTRSPALLPFMAAVPGTGPLLGPLARLDADSALGPRARQAAGAEREQAQRVAEVQRAMLEGVAGAATQGLLDLAPGSRMPDPQPASPADRPEAESQPVAAPVPDVAPSAPAASGPDEVASRPGLVFHTATDSLTAEPRMGATGSACLPDESFDLAAWAGAGDYATEIALRTARLTDERDRLDPEAVEALAQGYLAFGFGREALRALDMDGIASRERDLLRLLGRIIDGDAAPDRALEDQARCLGAVALWRALARNSLNATNDQERTAMAMTLQQLPDGLRSHLAPRLAGLFLDAGDPLGAKEVAALADEQTSTEAQLTRAAIVEQVEGAAPALDQLEDIADADPRMTPEGMVRLIDLSIKEGRPVPQDTLELARALRFEQGGPAGRRLMVAEARALAAMGRFDEALALLQPERSARPGQDLDIAMSDVVSTLAKDLDDAAFLELSLGDLPDDLPPGAVEAVAERLVKLGFPDEAWALRSPLASTPPVIAASTEVRPASRPVAGPEQEEPMAAESAEAALSLPPPGASVASGVPVLPETPVAGQPAVPDPATEPASSSEPALAGVAPGASLPGDQVTASVPSGETRGSATPTGSLTLAERRKLLEQAGEVRARAAALLAERPIE